MIRRNAKEKSDSIIEDYNNFCKECKEGDILYNIDKDNDWGEYLMVASKSIIEIGEQRTWMVVLLAMQYTDNTFSATGTHINLSPDKAAWIHYLKKVATCKFVLNPQLSSIKVNRGLLIILKDQKAWKYARQQKISRPKKRTYDVDGMKIVKKTGNKSETIKTNEK